MLFIGWYLVSAAYWVFHTPQVVAFSIIQAQPFTVPVGTRNTDPSTFPADWLLSAPLEPGDYWARIVVSPSMAVWHTVYLIGLTLRTAAVALPGRWRRPLIITGVLVAIAGVVLQKLVQP